MIMTRNNPTEKSLKDLSQRALDACRYRARLDRAIQADMTRFGVETRQSKGARWFRAVMFEEQTERVQKYGAWRDHKDGGGHLYADLAEIAEAAGHDL
jgi:hypothetical protein